MRRPERRTDSNRTVIVVATVAALVLAGTVLWSMWTETLQPLIAAGDQRAVLLHLIGLPLILCGVGIFVHGGVVFVRDSFARFQDDELLGNILTIRAKPSRAAVAAARRQNLQLLWRSWKPGLARLAFGFSLIALGGYIINL